MGLTTLAPPQEALLSALLRNESDVAYRRRVRRVVSYLDLAPGQTILDCGTGMGFYLKVLSALVPDLRLVGIDGEPKVLRYARQELDGDPVLVNRGDVLQLPYADASFDRVIMSEVLEHLTDDARGLEEVHRVLKPGGLLAITVPNARYPYWYDPISRVAQDLFRRPIRRGPFAGIWANHRRLYDRQELVHRVHEAGFLVERVEQLTHYCFPATQTLVYTFGKELMQRNLLPRFIRRSTDRFRGADNAGSRLNPLNWMLGVLDRFDRLNGEEGSDAGLPGKVTFVNIAIRARRP